MRHRRSTLLRLNMAVGGTFRSARMSRGKFRRCIVFSRFARVLGTMDRRNDSTVWVRVASGRCRCCGSRIVDGWVTSFGYIACHGFCKRGLAANPHFWHSAPRMPNRYSRKSISPGFGSNFFWQISRSNMAASARPGRLYHKRSARGERRWLSGGGCLGLLTHRLSG